MLARVCALALTPPTGKPRLPLPFAQPRCTQTLHLHPVQVLQAVRSHALCGVGDGKTAGQPFHL